MTRYETFRTAYLEMTLGPVDEAHLLEAWMAAVVA